MNKTISAAVGFIGCGGIASALSRGLCTSERFSGKIYVCDHHAEKTSALAADFPDQVEIVSSDQCVIDMADVVIPAIVPSALENNAPKWRFESRHRVVHIAAATTIAKASPWFAPACSIVRAVPLSFAARRLGPVVLFGEDELCEGLLSSVGTVVKVEKERDLEVLAAVTGVMVPYYGLVGEIVRWCVGKGMDFKSAMNYTTFMNEALSTLMRLDCPMDIESFMAANATPGGMNELAWNEMKRSDAYGPWKRSLDEIGERYGL